jgi:hypothetical protein
MERAPHLLIRILLLASLALGLSSTITVEPAHAYDCCGAGKCC